MLFVVFYYFWVDRFPELPVIFKESLLVGEYIHTLPGIEVVRLSMLLFLLLLALYSIMVNYPISVVNQRRRYSFGGVAVAVPVADLVCDSGKLLRLYVCGGFALVLYLCAILYQ